LGKVHTIVDEGTCEASADAFDPDADLNQHGELEDEIDSSSRAPPNMFVEWDILAECLVLADLPQDDGFYNAIADSFVQSLDTCGLTPIVVFALTSSIIDFLHHLRHFGSLSICTCTTGTRHIVIHIVRRVIR
jgi:hypothetical protein